MTSRPTARSSIEGLRPSENDTLSHSSLGNEKKYRTKHEKTSLILDQKKIGFVLGDVKQALASNLGTKIQEEAKSLE